MTERALTVTKQPDGSYRAARDGKQVDVRLGQTFGVTAIDDKRAQFDGLVALDAPQEETYAALVAWKVDAYAELAKRAGKGANDALVRKLAYWTGEAKRIDALAKARS